LWLRHFPLRIGIYDSRHENRNIMLARLREDAIRRRQEADLANDETSLFQNLASGAGLKRLAVF